MRQFIKQILVVLSIIVVAACHKAPSPMDQELQSLDFKPAKYEEWQLENGLKVIYAPNTEVPLVSAALYIKGGSYWDSADLNSASAAMGAMLRQGGTVDYAADQLDSTLENLSATISSSFGQEFGSINFSCLSSDYDQVFKIFSQVVLQPRFENSRFDLWKSQAVERVRRRNDDAGTVAQVSFTQLIGGDNTPFGRVVVESDVKKLQRKDLFAAHKRFVQPKDAIFIVAGKISRDKVKNLIQQYFGTWQNTAKLPPAPVQSYQVKSGIYFIDMDFPQANIFMGQQGPARHSADQHAISAFNLVFGGGFGSRLFKQVRTDLGYAYVVGGAVTSGLVHGINYMAISTKSENAPKAIDAAVNVIDQLKKDEISTKELKSIQHILENSFIFKYQSPESVISDRASLMLQGYADDYNDTFLSHIHNLQPSDLRDVALNHWNPAQFVIIVVGDKKAYSQIKQWHESKPRYFADLPLKLVKFDQKLILD